MSEVKISIEGDNQSLNIAIASAIAEGLAKSDFANVHVKTLMVYQEVSKAFVDRLNAGESMNAEDSDLPKRAPLVESAVLPVEMSFQYPNEMEYLIQKEGRDCLGTKIVIDPNLKMPLTAPSKMYRWNFTGMGRLTHTVKGDQLDDHTNEVALAFHMDYDREEQPTWARSRIRATAMARLYAILGETINKLNEQAAGEAGFWMPKIDANYFIALCESLDGGKSWSACEDQ